MEIRKVTVDDAKELLDIYAPYVEKTAITFEYDVPSVNEFEERIKKIGSKYPYIAAVEEGKIVGYAYASAFKERAAYQWSVETSIYVDMQKRQNGVGRLLYEALEQRLREQGILNSNACISYTEVKDEHLTNDSVHFHEKLGYELVAHFHKCGKKFGKWYDMVWMEKMLGEHK
jgi:phosphinothricin acetyltransferase